MTTEGGLDVVANEKAIADTRKKMNDAGIEVSLFIAPDEKQIEAARAPAASLWNCTPARLRRNLERRATAVRRRDKIRLRAGRDSLNWRA